MEFIPINVEVGNPITLTTTTGATLTGEVADLLRDSDDNLLAIAVTDDPNRPDPVWVRADFIMVWRLGAAVRVSGNPVNIPVDGELMRRIRRGS